MSTLSSVMQRPSAAKLWQQPAASVLPSLPFCASRSMPDDVQANVVLSSVGENLELGNQIHSSIRSSDQMFAGIFVRI